MRSWCGCSTGATASPRRSWCESTSRAPSRCSRALCPDRAIASGKGVTQRPLIGMCTALERARYGHWHVDAFLLQRSYVEAVQHAGGSAVMLPPDPDADPDQLLDVIDGLILAGGRDIDPESYGAERHPLTDESRSERDEFEIRLARRAMERDIPLLGICRGMQLMNVARGGTL